MHQFTQQDLNNAKNLARLMNKAKIELEGLEILAASDVIKWIGKLIKDIEQNIASQQAVSSIKPDTVVSSPVKEAPKRKRKES
jgi:hypothetical protein